MLEKIDTYKVIFIFLQLLTSWSAAASIYSVFFNNFEYILIGVAELLFSLTVFIYFIKRVNPERFNQKFDSYFGDGDE